LSYRRAADLFSAATNGWTLHQLRHSALTHAAEHGTNTPILLARSRHASVRSLERYARPGPEAVGSTADESGGVGRARPTGRALLGCSRARAWEESGPRRPLLPAQVAALSAGLGRCRHPEGAGRSRGRLRPPRSDP
jgi:hypothetical protein